MNKFSFITNQKYLLHFIVLMKTLYDKVYFSDNVIFHFFKATVKAEKQSKFFSVKVIFYVIYIMIR